MKKLSLIILIIVFFSIFSPPITVKAQTLDEEIESQLNEINFEDFNDFYSEIDDIYEEYNFFEFVKSVLNGEINTDYKNVFSHIVKTFFNKTKSFMPTVLSILAISMLTGLLSKLKSAYITDGVNEVISLVCVFLVITLLFNQFLGVYNSAITLINNISGLNQAISPILLTLMTASGGNVSASVYKPVVSMLSGTIINIFANVLVPIIGLMTILMIISNFSSEIKLSKFIELISSIFKWIIGILVAIFGIFLSAQGIVSSVHDGISLRATKYAISNSIPLIGGFLSSGLDIVISGSILIKNAVGVSSIFLLFYMILTPVLNMLSLSFTLKLCSGFSDCFENSKVSNLCSTLSKSISYLIVCVLMVGFMFFISLLLILFSANTFI